MSRNTRQNGEDLDPLGGRLLTPQEVAERLQTTDSALRRLRRKGTGPPVVMISEGTRRYPEDGLLLWIRDNAELPREDIAS